MAFITAKGVTRLVIIDWIWMSTGTLSANTGQKCSFSLRISSVNVTNPQFPTDLVTFTEEILNEKLQFLCSDIYVQLLVELFEINLDLRTSSTSSSTSLVRILLSIPIKLRSLFWCMTYVSSGISNNCKKFKSYYTFHSCIGWINWSIINYWKLIKVTRYYQW